MAGDVGLVSKLVEVVFSWVTSEDGLRQWRRRKLMAERDRVAQEMLANARTKADWDALRAYADESVRLSNEP